MQFCDTHIHLQDIKTDLNEFIKTAKSLGINRFITVCATESDWKKAAAIAAAYPKSVTPAFAVHPWYTKQAQTDWEKRLEKMLNEYPEALIGECGFDLLKNKDIKTQAEVFDIHLQLAKKYHRPLLIHAVKAEMPLAAYWQKMPEKFIIHSFNGSGQILEKTIKHGGCVSLNAKILNKKNADEILRFIPAEHLLFESDAPYQTRVEDIIGLCKRIAAAQGKSVENLAQIVYANSIEVLK